MQLASRLGEARPRVTVEANVEGNGSRVAGKLRSLIATLTEGACTYEIDKLTSFPTGVV